MEMPYLGSMSTTSMESTTHSHLLDEIRYSISSGDGSPLPHASRAPHDIAVLHRRCSCLHLWYSMVHGTGLPNTRESG